MKFALTLVLLSFLICACSDPVVKSKIGDLVFLDQADTLLQKQLDSLSPLRSPGHTFKFLIKLENLGLVIPPLNFDTSGVDLQTPFWVYYSQTDYQNSPEISAKIFGRPETVRAFNVNLGAGTLRNIRSFILNWIQMGITIGASTIILLLWITFHYRRSKGVPDNLLDKGNKEYQKVTKKLPLYQELRNDLGVLFLVLALLFWAATGIININADDSSGTAQAFIRFFSLGNNCFFLLSLPYFRYGIPNFINFQWFYTAIGAIFLAISFYIFYLLGISDQNVDKFKWFDILYSALVISALGSIIAFSFWKRNLQSIALLTIFITFGVASAQIAPHFSILTSTYPVFYTILYQVTLILFLILLVSVTFSWYQEEMVQEAIKVTNDRFVSIQEYMIDEAISNFEKREMLGNFLIHEELDLVFTGLSYAPQLNDSIHDQLILLRSRLVNIKREFYTGLISALEFNQIKSQVRAGLQEMIRQLLPD